MSELKAYKGDIYIPVYGSVADAKVYLKSEADKVIADLEESHKMEVEQLLMEIVELKDKLRHYPIMATLLESDKKEISELKAQKAKAEDDCAYWKMSEGNAVNAMHETEEYAMQLYKGLRHQKFKRCLAMARWCHERSLWWYSKGYGFEKYDKFWEKWEKRWLELAEHYKESK